MESGTRGQRARQRATRRTLAGEIAKSQARFILNDDGAKPRAARGSSIGLIAAFRAALGRVDVTLCASGKRRRVIVR